MKIQRIAAAAMVAALPLGAASAGEFADQCVERLEADGRDTSGCVCLEEQVEGDQALIEELTALAEIDDAAERYASASVSAKAAMDACTR